jgi:hypothetical protein
MDRIEQAAFVSVGRACGFASLAIFCAMTGLSFEPRLAAEFGGMLSFGLTLVLGYRARQALDRPYRQTETWLMLADTDRPQEQVAQQRIGTALREAYVWFARHAAAATVVLWLAVMVLSVTGVE